MRDVHHQFRIGDFRQRNRTADITTHRALRNVQHRFKTGIFSVTGGESLASPPTGRCDGNSGLHSGTTARQTIVLDHYRFTAATKAYTVVNRPELKTLLHHRPYLPAAEMSNDNSTS